MHYRDRLSPKVRTQLEELIATAIEGIKRHEVKSGYTNIFAKKIWNCHAFGHCANRPELFDTGRKLLDEWLTAVSASGMRKIQQPDLRDG